MSRHTHRRTLCGVRWERCSVFPLVSQTQPEQAKRSPRQGEVCMPHSHLQEWNSWKSESLGAVKKFRLLHGGASRTSSWKALILDADQNSAGAAYIAGHVYGSEFRLSGPTTGWI
jgi:hypothetical protein